MDRPKMEPNADVRSIANTLRQMYVALLDEGFTEQQALVLLGQTISASIAGNAKGST
jgi:hypothetical protein